MLARGARLLLPHALGEVRSAAGCSPLSARMFEDVLHPPPQAQCLVAAVLETGVGTITIENGWLETSAWKTGAVATFDAPWA